MVQFVQAASAAGIIFLPTDVLDSAPKLGGGPFREMELLSLSDDRIAEADETNTLDLLAATQRRIAHFEAKQTRALARLNELRKGSQYVGDEAALELRMPRGAAANRVATASDLVKRMPLVLAAMGQGEWGAYTASRLLDACKGLPDDDAREVDRRIADKLRAETLNVVDPVALRRTVKRIATNVNADAATLRARKARCGRKVQLCPGDDAMSRLIADLPAEVANAAYTNIDDHARRLRNGGDPRNLDQLRADVLGDLLSGGTDGSGKGGALVFLHMPITAALTMSDEGCELAGYGPIPGPVAREIMTNPNSVLRKVLVDPTTGAIKGLGRSRRRPNQALRDLIAVRDRECAFCHRPARHCDIDHLAEWARDEGGTDPDNLGGKCEHDHYLKDEPGWVLDHDPGGGTATVTTPAGRSFTRHRESIIEPPTQPPDPEPEAEPPPPGDPPF